MAHDRPLPLRRRPLDWIILLFFFVNITVITYIVDAEQLIIDDPASFEYTAWPPEFFVDIIHNYGKDHDPLQYARPMWWKMTIWIDVLFFGPFYLFGIYAFWRGRSWIKYISIIYASVMITNVTIILGEEFAGPHAAPDFVFVLLLNLPWLLVPLLILYRMANSKPAFGRA
jgi:hypothetical protein